MSSLMKGYSRFQCECIFDWFSEYKKVKEINMKEKIKNLRKRTKLISLFLK
jgi:hypothetical protein